MSIEKIYTNVILAILLLTGLYMGIMSLEFSYKLLGFLQAMGAALYLFKYEKVSIGILVFSGSSLIINSSYEIIQSGLYEEMYAPIIICILYTLFIYHLNKFNKKKSNN